MRKTTSIILLVAFINLLLADLHLYAQDEQPKKEKVEVKEKKKKTASEEKKKKRQLLPADDASRKISLSQDKQSDEREVLGVLKSLANIPPAEIPVLENALGDMNQDSVVNILDLLRVRDIVIGQGPSPSAYELVEGDLNIDGAITDSDLSDMQEIILFKNGVPSTIDSSGGVLVNGTTSIVIPPGAINEPMVLSVSQIPDEEVEDKSGLNFNTLTNQGYSHMASFELNSPNGIQTDLPFQLQETFLGDTTNFTAGFNALYQSYPDADGDGQPELRLVSKLSVIEDTVINNHLESNTAIIIVSQPVTEPPIIGFEGTPPIGIPGDTIDITMNSTMGASFPVDLVLFIEDQVSGNYLKINGDEWLIEKNIITGIRLVIPPILPGDYYIKIKALQNNLSSNTIPLTVLHPIGIVNPDTIIQVFYDDLLEIYSYEDEDSSFYENYLEYKYFVEQGLLFEMRDSILALDLQFKERIAAYVLPLYLNINPQNESPQFATANTCRKLIKDKFNRQNPQPVPQLDDCDYCLECIRVLEDEKPWRRKIKMIIDLALFVGPPIAFFCGSPFVGFTLTAIAGAYIFFPVEDNYDILKRLIVHCTKQPDCDPFDPDPEPEEEEGCDNRTSKVTVENYNPTPNGPTFHCMTFDGCNQDGNTDDCPSGSGNSGNKFSPQISSALEKGSSPIAGAIISSASGLVRSSIIDKNGKFSLQIPTFLDTLSLRIYDPQTGLFDDDFWHGPLVEIEGNFVPIQGKFEPDTTRTIFTLTRGEWAEDSITVTSHRLEYNFFVSPDSIGKEFNFGLSAENPLFFMIQDPNGNEIYRNTDVACEYVLSDTLSMSGTYVIVVTKGLLGGEGPFTIGVNYTPYPPIPYLCEEIPYDTLYAGFDYISKDTPYITPNDTITMEAGAALQLESRGSVTVNGALQGQASAENPIILKPADSANKTASRKPTNNRKAKLRRQ